MKGKYLLLLLVLYIGGVSIAQKKSKRTYDWKQDWSEFNPNLVEYPKVDTIISGEITTDLHLTRFKTYALSGDVYVTNNAKLSIGAGTIIRCDSQNPANLIITKGAKLVAIGSSRIPIVLTSNQKSNHRKAGDWGGIYIMGSGGVQHKEEAKNEVSELNDYGGESLDEESVIMKYVRLEYGGKAMANSSTEGSALNLFALGSSSTLENIMVSYSLGDSYSFKGGDGYFSKLISYKTGDDDFQIEQGYKGGIKKSLVLRDPSIIKNERSYAIEANGNLNNTEEENMEETASVQFASFRNFVFATTTQSIDEIKNKPLVSLSNLAKVHIFDSTISGFSNVVFFNSAYTSVDQIRKSFTVNRSLINISGDEIVIENGIDQTYLKSIVRYNRYTGDFVSFNQIFKNTEVDQLANFSVDEVFIKSARITDMD